MVLWHEILAVETATRRERLTRSWQSPLGSTVRRWIQRRRPRAGQSEQPSVRSDITGKDFTTTA